MRPPARRRTLPLMGGSNVADCAVALSYLAAGSRMVRGPTIERYERAFADRITVTDGVSFALARVGFYGILGGLAVGSGDEVLLQLPTHAVVVNAIRYRGAVPVFVDCEPATGNIDLEAAERQVSSRTKAVLVQHTFGLPADLDAAVQLADRRGIALIEDCVHSLGATFRDRPIGSFGRAAFFSTEETKTMSTTLGGMVVTADASLAAELRRFQGTCEFASRGTVASYLLKFAAYWLFTQPDVHHYVQRLYERIGRHHPFPRPSSADERRGLRPPSYERRLSNAQARLGLGALRRLDGNVAHRRRIAEIYGAQLPGRGGLAGGDGRACPVYVRYPVVVSDRQAALDALSSTVVGDVWFNQVVQGAEAVESFGYVPGSCPHAEYLAGHLVNLPTHVRVRPAEAEHLAELVAPFVAPLDDRNG